MTCLRCVIYWPRDLGPLSLGSQLYGPGRRCPPIHPHFLVLDEKVSLVSFPSEQRLYLNDPQLKPVHGAATWGERAHARRPSDAFARACRAPPTTRGAGADSPFHAEAEPRQEVPALERGWPGPESELVGATLPHP